MALVLLLAGIGGGTWWQLERARGTHPDAAVDGVRALLRVLVIFALVTPFFPCSIRRPPPGCCRAAR